MVTKQSNSDQPATQRDLEVWAGEIMRLTSKAINESEKRLMRYFNVVAENIHLDVAGANQDEITSLKDHQEDHEIRIISLEKHLK